MLLHEAFQTEPAINIVVTGAAGQSNYSLWLEQGNVGTEAQFLEAQAAAAAAEADRAEAAAEVAVEAAGKASFAFVDVDSVTYDAAADVISTAAETSFPRTDASGFTGFAVAFDSAGAAPFNAIGIPVILRDPAAVKKWARIDVTVKHHATEPGSPFAEIVAVGRLSVDPDSNRLSMLKIPLRHPVTDEFLTVDPATLEARFGYSWQAFDADGVPATAGESYGPLTGAAFTGSYFVQNTNAATGGWDAYFGDPTLAIGTLLLTNPGQEPGYAPSTEFRESLGVTSTLTLHPLPQEIIAPPRWFGMVGKETALYHHGLITGMGPRWLEFTGPTGLGRQQGTIPPGPEDRFLYPADGPPAAGTTLTVRCQDADHLNDYDSAAITLNIVYPNAAAAAARRAIFIGDSFIDAGGVTMQVLARDAENPDGVQFTLLGTRGAGANKHEGRSGWTVDMIYASDSAGGVDNPFVSAPGQKFNAAAYLAATGQAAPDIVLWDFCKNDIYFAGLDAVNRNAADEEVHAIMDAAINKLDRMIGIIPDAAVGSWKEANAAVKTLIATPCPPAATQTAFGQAQFTGQSYAHYKRNVGIAAWRLIDHYGGKEADGIFIVPFHVSMNPITPYDLDYDALHPTSPEQFAGAGDQAYFAINALVALGAA